MSTHKDKKNGTWYVMVRYHDWKGEKKQKCKRGFATKREAQEWERTFQLKEAGDPDMTFEAFLELYERDMHPRLKESTWLSKEHMIRTKLLPYFGKRMISEIDTKDIIAWQNELLAYRDEKKQPFSPTYLKAIHNQLVAVLNHAVKHYGLKDNAASKVGYIGSKESEEMQFWTKEEYQKFATAIIRIHDIRHSAISLLIDMGFSAIAIADRVGHESIDITYNYAHLFPSKQTEMAARLNMERG